MKTFNLPDLGEGLAEAEIREWYVKEGDQVKVDQPLLSVETAKAVVDVPSPYEGKITKLYGKAHEIIKTHAPLVEFDNEGSTKKDQGSVVGRLEENSDVIQRDEMIVGQKKVSTLKVSPMVKAMAAQLKVDLNTVQGSGPNGQITMEDVKKSTQSATANNSGEAIHGVRRVMAQTMHQSHQEVAPVTIMDDVNISHLPDDADFTTLILQGMAIACKAVPELNAWFDGKNLKRQLFTDVNIGLAINTQEGLFVPVIKGVDKLSSSQIREKINFFKKGALERNISMSDLQGATISLSNFGTIAGKYASPIVVPPTIAILGCGKTFETAVVKGGRLEVGKILPLSLSVDHRAVTGAEAARFLAEIIKFLEQLN